MGKPSAVPAGSAPVVEHTLLVRVTHWMTAVCVTTLVVSGVAILLAHPRLYWGETGAVGTPSLVDLPLPFVFGPSGWGRSLHFLSAWVSVLTGLVYVGSGLRRRHFQRHLVPTASDRTWGAVRAAAVAHVHITTRRARPGAYNVLQRLAYLAVIFVLFPAVIWTGFAMSPTLTAVAPVIVTMLGGQQSARTIHFVIAVALCLFVVAHIVMVSVSGFTARMRAMLVGPAPRRVESGA